MKKRIKFKFRGIHLLILFMLFAVMLMAGIILKNNNRNIQNSLIETGENVSNKNVSNESKVLECGWDNEIIEEVICENVPLPVNYEYVSGTTETGVTVKDENGNKYLWIPYQDIDESSENKTNKNNSFWYSEETDVTTSREKYGGFYVSLSDEIKISDINKLTQSEYEKKAAAVFNDNQDIINTHVLSENEIQQIETYLEKSDININVKDIGITVSSIQAYSNLRVDLTTIGKYISEENIKKWGSILAELINNTNKTKDYVYMLKLNNNTQVPIPSGFKYCENNGIVSIQDTTNSNLIYIWVPVSDIKNAKNELKKLYENFEIDGYKFSFNEDTPLYRAFNLTSEEYDSEFLESVNKYGGFYMSEAELSYDSSGKFYNKGREGAGESVPKMTYGGDYYRGSTYNYDKAKEIISGISKNNNAVVSHMMYGAEYDAAVLWIRNTNKLYTNIDELLLYNSTNIGKYSNSNLDDKTMANQSSAYLNGIWGLAGNLSEMTSEMAEGYRSLRGGAYNVRGDAYPVSSRYFANDNYIKEKGESVGYRACLYIKPGIEETSKVVEKYIPDNKDDIIEDKDTDDKPSDSNKKLEFSQEAYNVNTYGYRYKTTINGVTYKEFRQTSSKWGSVPFSPKTIRDNGCGATSIALILSGFKKYQSKEITPVDVSKGMNFISITKGLDNYGIKYKLYKSEYASAAEIAKMQSTAMYVKTYYGADPGIDWININEKMTDSKLESILKDGRPVIAFFSSNTVASTGKPFTTWYHFSPILAVNDKKQVYVSNTYESTSLQTGWTNLTDTNKVALYYAEILDTPDNITK